MTKSEYQELVEFLGVRFTKVDERFLGLEQRFEKRFDGMEQRLTRTEVLEEQNRATIQTVAEGVANVYRKTEALGAELAAFRGEVDARFTALTGEMNARFEAVDGRFETVDARFETVDARFDGVDSQLSELREQIAAGSARHDDTERRVAALERRRGG
jgi:chromosome segregation ATPase